MIVAKLIAATGLVLFVAGAAGAVSSAGVATGCLLLLVAAVIGAVVLEGRDLQPAAALLYSVDERDEEAAVEVAPVVELPTAA